MKKVFVSIALAAVALGGQAQIVKNDLLKGYKEGDVLEKTVYNGPQYNQQYEHNNNNPSQCRSKWEEIEDKIMSVSTYIIAAIISLCGSMMHIKRDF